MTPLPKRKLSRARQGKRRASIKLLRPTLTFCPNCKQPKTPHVVCPHCGFYNSKEVVSKVVLKKAHEEKKRPQA